jgi:hypothetical protein
MSYKDTLINRVPESYQHHEGVIDYLSVAGELFDEYQAAIVNMDSYRDFNDVDSRRIRQLAIDFGMNFPRNINEETQRNIIRDIHDIYSRVGIKRFTDWVFRLIGWEIDVQEAWLPNPNQYDPSIADIHKLDSYGKPSDVTITDFYSADYRAFYIGESYVADDGNVYFRGRRFFDKTISIDQLEIVGEHYDEMTKVRTEDKVGSTPYIFVNVKEENYTNFLNSYVYQPTGEIYGFNPLEQFTIIENILNYFVYDSFRPSHVRVVIIVKTETNEDYLTIYDDVSTKYLSKPLIMEDDGVVTLEETSRLDHTIVSGDLFMSGTPPHPFGRKMSIAPIDSAKWIGADTLRYSSLSDGSVYRYRIDSVMNFQPVPLSRTNEFSFYTPDKEEYDFRLVFATEDDFLSAHIELGTLEDVYDFPFPEDHESLSLLFDLKTDSYGIMSSSSSTAIIIREPTTVTSNAFDRSGTMVMGNTTDSGVTFADDFLLKTNFKTNSCSVVKTLSTFTYYSDLTIKVKEHNRNPLFTTLMNNPDIGDLDDLVDWNTIMFVPNIPLGFDLVVDTKYRAQPTWENDPRP